MSETAMEHGRTSAFGRFLPWWLDGLAAAFETRRRAAGHWTHLAVKSANGLSYYVRERGAVRLVRDIPPAALDGTAKRWRIPADAKAGRRDITVLRLAEDQVLRHETRIPNGARDVVDPIIRNQLERLVPWGPDELIYGYDIADGDAETDHIRVACVATSRKRVNDARASARTLGIAADIIDVATDAQAPIGIELNGLGEDGRRLGTRRMGRGLLLVTLIAALVMAAGVWRLAASRSELAQLRTALAGVRSSVAEARRLEGENQALVAERARLLAMREREPAMAMALEALSKALPDHAYLERLEIRDREAELRGRSTDAASLMTGLESSRSFANARFSAPTTRKAGQGETFTISLRLESGNLGESTK